MSFFGFDTSGHNRAAPGFSQGNDPFAGLAQRATGGEAVDFDDTYDGLGDQLEEAGDELNDDTFGGDAGPSGGSVGKDFDFFGRTAQVSSAIDEEQLLYSRNNPASKAVPVAHAQVQQLHPSYGYAQQAYQPVRTGYEKYEAQNSGTDLQVDPTLWGVAPKQATPAPAQPAAAPVPAVGRKVMSLEEVEAAMKAEAMARKQAQASAAGVQASPMLQQPQMQQPTAAGFEINEFYAQPNRIDQHQIQTPDQLQHVQGVQYPGGQGPHVQILQRPQSKSQQQIQPNLPNSPSPMIQQRQQASSRQGQPTQILQNPNRMSGDLARMGAQGYPVHPAHQSQGSVGRQPIITHPAQLAQLSESDKAAYLEQEARRAKRNHKIFLLSRDNGIMTPHDKNFITRIQLQQLVSATGNPADHGTDEALAEDFYYQVHNQIRGGQRQNPSQPLSNFAQTYLFQTGNRQGGHRRHRAGPENHMQRMEQQVQRAVEAAKNKPKNSQLVIEGSLGKISFSNAKTPKPLLNIKRTESNSDAIRQGTPHKAHAAGAGYNKKAVLTDVEKVYDTLMKLEDHERLMPPPVLDENNQDLIQQHVVWHETSQKLTQKLWRELKIHEPVPAGASIHPFIAMLETAKGKKALARVFRHVNHEQRTTILTLIIVNLDKFDVVRRGSVTDGHVNLDAKLREDIELFSVAVCNTLFVFLGELGLDIITGILGVFCSEVNVDLVARTRVGVSFLTMILSRAEIMIQAAGGRDAISGQDGGAWERHYSNFFNQLEPTLPHIFPGTPASGEDGYVWQLLAALGIGANAEQQQRLVVAVKDRVLGTVEVAKTLPQDLAVQRLANVNLFMQAIGLDVSLLG
ncbi:topoisomerase II-associated protein PAT1 [Coniella lustricola]|uniref:Topoisomerase II-associated protein PAT1 n=1 Tax=Coniella lustricola TaxID=2025994 RepID=A0A2T3ANY4_9PEZI|nr:topoisomerase II-associated protein PAT1 [Coniella lustricola]